MSKTLRASAAAALAALLQFTPTASMADLATASHTPAWETKEREVPAAFLDRTVDLSAARLVARTLELHGHTWPHEQRMSAPIGEDEGRAFRLADERVQTGNLPRRGSDDLDLSLWNLLNIVRSQKEGRPFDELERHFRYQVDNPANQPSAVPLPASVWLLVMGGLGLFGARFTGISGAGSGVEGRRRAPMLQAAAT